MAKREPKTRAAAAVTVVPVDRAVDEVAALEPAEPEAAALPDGSARVPLTTVAEAALEPEADADARLIVVWTPAPPPAALPEPAAEAREADEPAAAVAEEDESAPEDVVATAANCACVAVEASVGTAVGVTWPEGAESVVGRGALEQVEQSWTVKKPEYWIGALPETSSTEMT